MQNIEKHTWRQKRLDDFFQEVHQDFGALFFACLSERGRFLKEQILLLVELQNVDNEMEELLLKKVNLPAGIASLDEELEANCGKTEGR